MITCFVFDINGVIFSTSGQTIEGLIAEGFSKEKLVQITSKGELGQAYYAGEISFSQYHTEVYKLFGDKTDHIISEYFTNRPLLSIDKQKFIEKIYTPFSLQFDITTFPEKIQTLELCKILYKTYDLCLFSGNGEDSLKEIDDIYNFFQYFTYKVFSYIVGADKPDDRMFKALKQTLPFPLSNCIYIDDIGKNIEKGKKYGCNGILFSDLV